MEIFIPNAKLKGVSEVLAKEGVAFTTGKESHEATAVNMELVETEVPAILDQDEARSLRAFRLPSGNKILLTDADGNFDRLVEPPAGWAR